MYRNLERCLKEKGISHRDYAAFLGISEQEAGDRIRGEEEFTLQEIRRTGRELFPEHTLSFLFSMSGLSGQ